MSYATTDYSSYGRSVGHGGIYEVDFIKPVDIWDWVYTTTYIYAKFDAYEKFHKELLEFEVFYNGDFDISGDSFNEGNSTIDSAYTFDKYGAAGTTFSSPISWSEISNTNYSGNNFGTKIIGSPYDDVIYGDAGNDSIKGGSGDDVIDGGSGDDIAIYSGPKIDYSITLSPQYQLVIKDADLAGNNDGMDSLTGIESVRFEGSTFNIETLRSEALLNTPSHTSSNVSRLFNNNSGRHLFSANQSEIDYLIGGGYGWVNEGISYSTPDNSTAEVYRFLVSDEGRHFYTANKNERDLIRSSLSNFIYEGIAYEVYSIDDYPADATAVVRYYNSSINSHVYSTSGYEQQVLNQNTQWINEGIAWYGEAAI